MLPKRLTKNKTKVKIPESRGSKDSLILRFLTSWIKASVGVFTIDDLCLIAGLLLLFHPLFILLLGCFIFYLHFSILALYNRKSIV